MAQTTAGQLAQEACVKFPTSPTRSLAQMLIDAPGGDKVFRDFDHARDRIRYYRGEQGKASKATVKSSGALISTKKPKFNIPDSDAVPLKPYRLKYKGKGAVLADLHIPYHDKDALTATLDYCIDNKCTDFVVLNGDIIDCYRLSRWAQDPRQRNFAKELETARDVLRTMKSIFGNVVYKMGNHEKRYEQYMFLKAPQLLDLPGMSWGELLDLKAIGIDLVEYNQLIYAGPNLTILHGHEYGGNVFNPVNPARGMFLRAKACTISGHNHQTSQHTAANIRRVGTSCWSLGCLCELSPDYSPVNNWDHGFITLEFDGKWFDVDSKRIIDGRVT